MDIRLRFINQSNDQNNSDVAIFQRNVEGAWENPVAWTVIRNCGRGDSHPFTYPFAMTVGAGDSWGNFTPQLPASPGQMFKMVFTPSGDQLVADGAATLPEEVQVLNALERGAISASVYRAGRLLATKPSIAPMQKAVFQFKPTLWIGVVSQIEEGQVMNAAITSTIETEISLEGLASADIVMTGGGPGRDAQPFAFTLQNIVMA